MLNFREGICCDVKGWICEELCRYQLINWYLIYDQNDICILYTAVYVHFYIFLLYDTGFHVYLFVRGVRDTGQIQQYWCVASQVEKTHSPSLRTLLVTCIGLKTPECRRQPSATKTLPRESQPRLAAKDVASTELCRASIYIYDCICIFNVNECQYVCIIHVDRRDGKYTKFVMYYQIIYSSYKWMVSCCIFWHHYNFIFGLQVVGEQSWFGGLWQLGS